MFVLIWPRSPSYLDSTMVGIDDKFKSLQSNVVGFLWRCSLCTLYNFKGGMFLTITRFWSVMLSTSLVEIVWPFSYNFDTLVKSTSADHSWTQLKYIMAYDIQFLNTTITFVYLYPIEMLCTSNNNNSSSNIRIRSHIVLWNHSME